jgi:hypothetical protein
MTKKWISASTLIAVQVGGIITRWINRITGSSTIAAKISISGDKNSAIVKPSDQTH